MQSGLLVKRARYIWGSNFVGTPVALGHKANIRGRRHECHQMRSKERCGVTDNTRLGRSSKYNNSPKKVSMTPVGTDACSPLADSHKDNQNVSMPSKERLTSLPTGYFYTSLSFFPLSLS